MTWHDPGWLELTLLIGLAYRLTRLVAADTITEGLRVRLTAIVERDDEVYVGKRQPKPALRAFITCPWCVGFWIAVIVAVAWWAAPSGTIAVAVPFTISLAVGLIARWLDP